MTETALTHDLRLWPLDNYPSGVLTFELIDVIILCFKLWRVRTGCNILYVPTGILVIGVKHTINEKKNNADTKHNTGRHTTSPTLL